MVYAWLSAFAPLVANWQSSQVTFDPFYRMSICRSPKGTSSDGSLTVYADDLAKVILLQGPGQYKSATAKAAVDSVALSTAALSESLGPAGIAQNTQKTEIIPTFIGEGSFQARRAFAILNKGATSSGRHLGSQQSYCNSNNTEVQNRIRSMWAAFHFMHNFWRACKHFPMKKTIFTSNIVSASVSGLEVFCLSRAESDRIQKATVTIARRVLGKTATRWKGAATQTQRFGSQCPTSLFARSLTFCHTG